MLRNEKHKTNLTKQELVRHIRKGSADVKSVYTLLFLEVHQEPYETVGPKYALIFHVGKITNEVSLK